MPLVRPQARLVLTEVGQLDLTQPGFNDTSRLGQPGFHYRAKHG